MTNSIPPIFETSLCKIAGCKYHYINQQCGQSHKLVSQINVWSCTSILRVMPSPAHQVQYPHFTICVRGLCHGITPLFLLANAPGAPLALRHAALCLAKRVYRRGSEALQTSAAAVQALQRPQAVSWPHPPALLCRLCAGGAGTRGAATASAATADHLQSRTPAPRGHLAAVLPPSGLCVSGSGGARQSQCEWSSQRWPLATAVLQPM